MKLYCILAFVFPVVYCLTTDFTLYKSVDRGCPAPYFPVGQHCFYVNRATKTWPDARAACQRIGGDLADPFSEYVLLEALRDRIDNWADRWYWVGGEIFSVGGDVSQWKWFSGRPVTEWSGNQPDNRPGGEHCLMMGLEEDPPMYDYFCNKTYQSICAM